MVDDLSTFAVAKLDLREGDTVVFRVSRRFSHEQIVRFEERQRQFMPDGVKVLVLSEDVKMSVLRAAAKAEARSTR